MRYFDKIAEGVGAVKQIAHQLVRPRVPIVVSLVLREVSLERAEDEPAMRTFPQTKKIALGVMQAVDGVALGRIEIVRISQGKKTTPSSFASREWAWTSYIVVIQGFPGAPFTCGDEAVNMLSGEVWWYDETAEHFITNNSADELILMHVDVRIDPP